MRREDRGPASPQAWLRYAQADLSYASTPRRGDLVYELSCFHIQQAVEKALKAALLFLQIEFPYTHNIQVLLDLLPDEIRSLGHLQAAVELNAYAVLARYPRDREDIDEAEYLEALRIGESVVSWAHELVAARK